jgi:hypothetical protein
VDFQPLLNFLSRCPAIDQGVGHGVFDDGRWWVKFGIDLRHPLAWHVVQEFGCVLNYVSITERLPTVFFPVSPAPYLNGGPRRFLAWVIESKTPDFTPGHAAEWLVGRLPKPLDNASQWPADEEEDDDVGDESE